MASSTTTFIEGVHVLLDVYWQLSNVGEGTHHKMGLGLFSLILIWDEIRPWSNIHKHHQPPFWEGHPSNKSPFIYFCQPPGVASGRHIQAWQAWHAAKQHHHGSGSPRGGVSLRIWYVCPGQRGLGHPHFRGEGNRVA